MESVVDSMSTASERSGGSSGGSPKMQGKRTGSPGGMPEGPLSPPGLRLPPHLSSHLPPPPLGLLGSLQMMHHASPLELMAAAHHHGPPRPYGSPPPISSSDPAANECKLVDYRGQKVAAFIIQGDTMLCLPQAFELFLKHLVGGLHTVYTKLKRLDIVPLVCNVEQVRILRGLGAIQPGVNRCKLLSCKDFDVLYRDCTTASSRPGRPPKRASVGLSLAATHLSGGHPFKKHRMENGEYSPYENGHLGDISRLEKSPLLANGYNAPPTHLGHMGFMHAQHAAALMSPGLHGVPRPDPSMVKQPPGMPNMEALARSGIWENCRAAYEDIVKHLERLRDERGDMDRALALDNKIREGSQNGSSAGHSPVLNLSKSGCGHTAGSGGGAAGSGGGAHSDDGGSEPRSPGARSRSSLRAPDPASGRSTPSRDLDSDPGTDLDERDDKDDQDGDLSDVERDLPTASSPTPPAINYTALAAAAAAAAAAQAPGGGGSPAAPSDAPANAVSSTETLLRNIQGLLKVAADNARQQERQISYEKAELKMDVLREREVKDNLERQLMDEQKMRVLYQKRLRKERRARVRAQEELAGELKLRSRIEDALKASGAPQEVLRILSETGVNMKSPQRERPESGGDRDRDQNRDRDRDQSQLQQQQQDRDSRPPAADSPPFAAPPPPQQTQQTQQPEKQWNYGGLDLMSSGAAFWQNYSESLAQELELERKQRQQALERDVKSPLSERGGYYKNSVLFGGAT